MEAILQRTRQNLERHATLLKVVKNSLYDGKLSVHKPLVPLLPDPLSHNERA